MTKQQLVDRVTEVECALEVKVIEFKKLKDQLSIIEGQLKHSLNITQTYEKSVIRLQQLLLNEIFKSNAKNILPPPNQNAEKRA